MCRLLGYLGSAIQLDRLLCKPEHSLIVQSYQPREMTAGIVNADGFGVGWYHPHKEEHPYTYKNILPIWSDLNLQQLSRYVETGCTLAYVRSATPPLAVDLSNCQPFTDENLVFIHNGFIQNFRQTLFRPIRNSLDDYGYQLIKGTTDSEHIFATIVNELRKLSSDNLETALANAIAQIARLANAQQIYFSANIILSNGKQIVASRYSNRPPTPTLYWIKDDLMFPDAVIVASEPLFDGDWHQCSERSIIAVTNDVTSPVPEVKTIQID